MEITVASASGAQEVVVTVNDADATVSDLVEAVARQRPGERVSIDGRGVPSGREVGLVGLYRGATIDLGTPPAADATALVELCVVGGTTAGRTLPMPDGEYAVGRDPGADLVLAHPSISKRHCRLTVRAGVVEVADGDGSKASKSGTWLDGSRVSHAVVPPGVIIDLGAAQLVVRPRDDGDRASEIDPARYANAQGEIGFNRSPRKALPPGPQGIAAPRAPETSGKPTFNPMTVAAPAVMGLTMVFVAHNVMFALMALLTPSMAIFNYLGSRRKHGKRLQRTGREFAGELKDFDSRLDQMVTAERRRRHLLAPDLAEVQRRASLPSSRLWERRSGRDDDFLALSVGLANLPWTPPVQSNDFGTLAPEVAESLARHSTLPAVPLVVNLATEGPIGIVGDRVPALALARALVAQAAVHHGPSDLQMVVFAGDEHADDWDWVKWLPHVRDYRRGDERLLLADVAGCEAVARRILTEAAAGGQDDGPVPMRFLIVDDHELTRRRESPIRELLKGTKVPATGVVIAPREDLLPEACTSIVAAQGGTGRAGFTRPQKGEHLDQVAIAGLDDDLARRCARSLARYEDPEIHMPGASLPRQVRITGLVGVGAGDVAQVTRRWDSYDEAVRSLAATDRLEKPPLTALLGVGESGPVALDLVNDGPHGLVGGTSGSGKTELLRSMVLALAATASPQYLSFLFIDFKGAAGFAKLDGLPHSVGLASNLDAAQAERVLDALRAELHFRQRKFQEAGAGVQELHEFWAASSEPLPRLVVVIDEFAEMADQMADFKSTIVQIGRIGRTLGVHLVLATQRPAGVVTADLKENTNYGIALRVNAPDNSRDIIGVADAATIPPRHHAGRAYLRVGTGQAPVLFQSALATVPVSATAAAPIEVAEFVFGPAPAAARGRTDGDRPKDGQTELAALVETIVAAWGDRPALRRPWLPPLPETLDLDELVPPGATGADVVVFARADDVAHQSQPAVGWDPRAGNLLIYGAVGSGTTTALAALALSIGRSHDPGRAHIYALDYGAGELLPLADLPEVGAVVTSTEIERQQRLRAQLVAELRARKSDPRSAGTRPRVYLLVDNYGSFATAAGPVPDLLDGINEIFTDGPDVGMYVAVTAERAGAIPMKLANVAMQKWVLRLADRGEYSAFRLPTSLSLDIPPGRGWIASEGLAMHVGAPLPTVAEAVARELETRGRTSAAAAAAPAVEVLPDDVPGAGLVPFVQVGTDPWILPVGISGVTLQPVGLRLHEGEHALVAGPARASKSSYLVTLAQIVRAAVPDVQIFGLLGKASSPLKHCDALDACFLGAAELAAAVEAHRDGGRPVLALIDDAQAVANDEAFVALLKSAWAGFHVVAAARSDELRSGSMFGHWTQDVRKSRTGLLLRISQGSDFDILGLNTLSRKGLDTRVGRGWLALDGSDEPVQVATHL